MEWDEVQRVVVVFAHPDDGEFGSAGTAALMARDGKEVVYVVATNGSKGSSDPEMTREQLIAIREREQRDAAHVLGVKDVCFLGFEDGVLEPSLELRKAVAGAIRRYKPDVVISQNPVRDLTGTVFAQHPDHLATGEATLAAVYPTARDRMAFPELLEQGLEPHAAREVWIVGTSMPDHFVDITSTIDLKVQALQAHVSQIAARQVDEFIPERARRLGEEQGMEYAEAFRRIIIG